MARDLEPARGALARGLARQAMDMAARDSADTGRLLAEVRAMKPNARSRGRCAARLRGRRGVVAALPASDGLVIVLRSVLRVDLRKDGASCYTEDRIAWTRFHVRNGKAPRGYMVHAVHVTRHVLHRRVERSDCPLSDLLGDMDAAMLRALDKVRRRDVLTDRDDTFVTAERGVWAGEEEAQTVDLSWGLAFADAPALPVFAIRTFLAEAEMRPTLWLGWSGGPAAA